MRVRRSVPLCFLLPVLLLSFLSGCVDSPPSDPAKTVPRLIDLLRDVDPAVRITAAQSLGKIGRVEAAPALVESSADGDPSVRAAVVWALGRLDEEAGEEARDEIGTVLAAAIDDPSVTVKEAAAAAIGQRGPLPRVVTRLVQFLQSPDAASRRAAATALGWLEAASTTGPLTEGLLDEDAGLRQRALSALGEIGDRHTIPKVLDRLIHDGDAGVRGEAAYRLGKLGDPQALALLRETAAKDEHVNVRRWAEWAMRELEGPTGPGPTGPG